MPAQKLPSGSPNLRTPTREKDLPATRGMLQLVRSELKADIRGVRSEMKEGFAKVDARFKQVDGRFSEHDAHFNRLEGKIEHLTAEVSRLGVLMEEQNANNRIVLEGLTGLWQRQERIESELPEKIEHAVARFITRVKS